MSGIITLPIAQKQLSEITKMALLTLGFSFKSKSAKEEKKKNRKSNGRNVLMLK